MYSSVRFHFPELNSGDTSAVSEYHQKFLKLSEINVFALSLISLAELLLLKLGKKKSAHIKEGNARAHNYLISQSLHPLCWNDEKSLPRAAEITFY